MITGVQDVHVNVSNMARSISFYRDTLALRLQFEGAERSVLDAHGMRFVLVYNGGVPVPPVGHRDGNPLCGSVVTFRVSDIFSMVDHLRSQGVKFLTDIDALESGSIATFSDPDGNLLKLMQPQR